MGESVSNLWRGIEPGFPLLHLYDITLPTVPDWDQNDFSPCVPSLKLPLTREGSVAEHWTFLPKAGLH